MCFNKDVQPRFFKRLRGAQVFGTVLLVFDVGFFLYGTDLDRVSCDKDIL